MPGSEGPCGAGFKGGLAICKASDLPTALSLWPHFSVVPNGFEDGLSLLLDQAQPLKMGQRLELMLFGPAQSPEYEQGASPNKISSAHSDRVVPRKGVQEWRTVGIHSPHGWVVHPGGPLVGSGGGKFGV